MKHHAIFGRCNPCFSSYLYKLYEQDPKQFALIQMNMGREVTRRLREADDRLFKRMGPDADISQFSWAAQDARGQPPRTRTLT